MQLNRQKIRKKENKILKLKNKEKIKEEVESKKR